MLLSGTGSVRRRLRIGLGHADVAADGVLANLVDHEFFRNFGSAEVEEDRLVHGAILLFQAAVFGGHGNAKLPALLINALEFDGQVADLLWLVLAGDREFDVVAFAKASQLIDFIVVARDQSAHFAARHFQVFAGGVKVGANADDLGVHVLHIIRGSFRRQLGMNAGVERRQLLRGVLIGCDSLPRAPSSVVPA